MAPAVAKCLVLLITLNLVTPGTTATEVNSLVLTPGDVTIAAMFRVNEVEDGGCGRYDGNSLQEIMALTWFVDSLNAMNYVNNVTIGLEVYRTCKIPTLASGGAVALLSKYGVGGQDSQDDSPLLLGIVGPDRTAEAVAVSDLIGSLLANQRVVEISGAATGKQLSNKTSFPNFFRVIPSDDIQMQVILELLLHLQWNYVAIVYDDDDYGKSAAEELSRLAEGRQICVAVKASLPLDVGSATFSKRTAEIAQQVSSTSSNGYVRGMVVLAGRASSQQLLRSLQGLARFVELVFSEAVGLQEATFLTSVSKGALVTSPPYLSLPEFVFYWNALWRNRTRFEEAADTNLWLTGYFEQVIGCQLSPTCWNDNAALRDQNTVPEGDNAMHELSLYIGYQVKAAAALATVLKRLHESKCGPSASGVCPQLREAVSGRTAVQSTLEDSAIDFGDFAPVSPSLANASDVSFDAQGEVVVTGGGSQYGVYNRQEATPGADGDVFRTIGSFSSGTLTIDKSEALFYDDSDNPLSWSELPPAQCDSGRDCLQCVRDVSNDVIFIRGDFYVLAILPVHAKNPSDPLACGEIKGLVGADLAQAVVFAVQKANEQNMLQGKTVGLVGITSCGSSVLVKQRLLDFFLGRLQLPIGTSADLLDHFMGVIGAYYSANSIAASDTLTAMRRPFVQVSAASTATELKDRTRHPYFMRLVPADDKQAQVMLDIVRRMGANYIQVLYDESTAYASGLYLKLQELASTDRYDICIAQAVPSTPRSDVSQYKALVSSLRDRSDARLVIVLLHAEEIDKVMEAILPLLTSSDNFLFLASESWGRRQNLIDGRTSLVNSLVLSQEIALDREFEFDFQREDPYQSLNPWLAQFWEARLGCYLDKSFTREGKTGPCPVDYASSYVQDSRVPFYIQSVYALVTGFRSALTQHCGASAASTCSDLTSSALVAALKAVRQNLYGGSQLSPIFDSNGDGLVGYKILRVSPDSSGNDVIYDDIGEWTSDDLRLQEELPSLTSVCPNQPECLRCFPARPPSPSRKEGGDEGVPGTTVTGLATGLGVVIVILLIIIGCQIWRRNRVPDTESSALRDHSA